MKTVIKTTERPASYEQAMADIRVPDPVPEAAEEAISSLVLSAIAPVPEQSELDKTLAAVAAVSESSHCGTQLLSVANAVKIFGSYAAAKSGVDTLRSLGVQVAIVGDHDR